MLFFYKRAHVVSKTLSIYSLRFELFVILFVRSLKQYYKLSMIEIIEVVKICDLLECVKCSLGVSTFCQQLYLLLDVWMTEIS